AERSQRLTRCWALPSPPAGLPPGKRTAYGRCPLRTRFAHAGARPGAALRHGQPLLGELRRVTQVLRGVFVTAALSAVASCPSEVARAHGSLTRPPRGPSVAILRRGFGDHRKVYVQGRGWSRRPTSPSRSTPCDHVKVDLNVFARSSRLLYRHLFTF